MCSRPAALPNEARNSVQARANPSPTSLAPWRSGSERSHTWRAASVERCARFAEGAFGLMLSAEAHLLELGLSCLLEALRARLHLLEARFEARHELAAERGGVRLQRGKLMAERVEIALELGPFLVGFGLGLGLLTAELRIVLVFHLLPHSREQGVKQGSGDSGRTMTDGASRLRSSQEHREPGARSSPMTRPPLDATPPSSLARPCRVSPLSLSGRLTNRARRITGLEVGSWPRPDYPGGRGPVWRRR